MSRILKDFLVPDYWVEVTGIDLDLEPVQHPLHVLIPHAAAHPQSPAIPSAL